MPNPNRPEYLDTIESTWGQAVADHVIRRYGSAAERDADLAGFTPEQLEGQIVNTNGTPQEFSHGEWVELRPVISEYGVFTTDGNGTFAVPLPAHAGWYGAVGNSADSVFAAYLVVNTTAGPPGTSALRFQIRNTTNNSLIANAACKVCYVAHIYFDPIA